MTECRDCHSTSVAWGKTKGGKPMLVEVRPQIPHFIFCSKQSGTKRKRNAEGSVPGRSRDSRRNGGKVDGEMLELLKREFGPKRGKSLLEYAVGADIQAKYLAVLAHVAEESE